MKADRIKANGVHYTPPELAKFLAEVVAEHLSVGENAIEVLDPACGGGALLFALAQAVPSQVRKNMILSGYETDGDALQQAAGLLAKADVGDVVLRQQDFLAIEGIDRGPRREQLSLLDDLDRTVLKRFDAVIANPPYVRTQVLGAAAAQGLARRFGLTGRVDLYHAFTQAMANVLKSGGVLGLLTSNRFLTVKSGASLRHLLRTEFQLEAIYDLGDTKLFAAAVLPAIVVARKQVATGASPVYDRVYELRPNGETPALVAARAGILDAFRDRRVQGLVRTRMGTFKIERGILAAAKSDETWSLLTPAYRRWLNRVEAQRRCFFDDVASIRVGIKTTADNVFIRDDWGSLPAGLQPEAQLLRPLLTHVETQRWIPSSPKRSVLYTHAIENGKRVAVKLKDFPRASAYLESHREQLSSRSYVIEAGREWYEIWVPQSPIDWRKPKIVAPDISEEPRFCFDASGAVVNGDCYWITLRPGVASDWLLLLLAIANSSFVTNYYDLAFHNKLYAGRRRFMTQYVKKFPLPDLESPVAQTIVQLVSEQIAGYSDDGARESDVNRLVWESFGLVKETAR